MPVLPVAFSGHSGLGVRGGLAYDGDAELFGVNLVLKGVKSFPGPGDLRDRFLQNRAEPARTINGPEGQGFLIRFFHKL